MQIFPFHGVTQPFVDQFNEESRNELESIRDFIVLHYHVTERDGAFWRDCRDMEIPESLMRRIQMFRQGAHAWQGPGELFRVDSWTQVMLGQGVAPRHYHQVTKAMSERDLRQFLSGLKASISQTVANLPSHQEFVDRYCKARSAA
jgi:tryptophan 7-halogenase